MGTSEIHVELATGQGKFDGKILQVSRSWAYSCPLAGLDPWV